MPKRKHVKKNVAAPCTDANQHQRERIVEQQRQADIRAKKLEELRRQYEEEMKKRKELEERKENAPAIISPTITPAVERDVANE
jgi:hypothetical protein